MAIFCTGDRKYNDEKEQGQHLNRFTLFITKKYLRTMDADYSGVSKVSLPNDLEVEVVIFSGEKAFWLGQATITRAIIVHEKCFKNEVLLHYVVAHEYGHHKSWFSFLMVPVITILWLYGLFAILWGFLALQLGGFILGLSIFLIGCAISWIIEYKADSVTIEILGMNQVTSARELMDNMPKLPLVWRIISRLTHLRFSWTLAIYKFFHKDKQNKICH